MPKVIYRQYDADTLWIQYNNQGMVPFEEREKIKRRRRLCSAAVRTSGITQLIDISYGSQERERLDLFLPENEGVPLYIYIHGGYWQKNDKEDYSFVAEALVSAGVAVAVVEYTLCPHVTLAELTDQIRHAVGYLWLSADKYGYDCRNILVSGHSAGGHLTAMMMATDWTEVNIKLPPAVVAAGMPISGIYDLEPIRYTPLNDAIGLTAEDIGPLSPMFLKPTSKAPVTVVVGAAESLEFNRQAEDFTRAWSAYGIEAKLLVLPKMNHYTVVFQLADPTSKLFKTAMHLMGKD